jgi:tRNA threonylcarbamoyladenosine biosynthesis protein TsaB
MRVLSLDTTARAGSVALIEDGRVVDERSGDGSRTHAERLPGEILAALAACAWPMTSIDLFAVAAGPGSFTGLRIGIATIQGMAFVERRPVVGVSALLALAHLGAADARPGEFVGAWIDARRHDVFGALYQVTDAAAFEPERLAEIEGPTVGTPSATLSRWSEHTIGSPITFVGDGAVLYRSVLAGGESASRRVADEVPPLAGVIGRVAARLAATGRSTGAAGLQPLYVRRPDAEVDRDKRASATAGKP